MEDEIIPQLNNDFNTSYYNDVKTPKGTTTEVQSFSPIPVPKMPEVQQFTPPKTNSSTGVNNYNPDIGNLVNPNEKDFKMYNFHPMEETHTLSDDGKTWIPKTETYVHGVDNEARIAMEEKKQEDKKQKEYEEVITDTYNNTSSSIGGQILFAVIIAGVIILLFKLIKGQKK